MRLAPALLAPALFALFVSVATANDDISILQFQQEIWAFAPAGPRMHRMEIPGGAVLATEVSGKFARVDVEEGTNLICTVPYGLAGRTITMDVGDVGEIHMGTGIALVTAEGGTALYFPGSNRLQGLLLSEGLPQAAMIYGDIVAVNWRDHVTLYGTRQGRLTRMFLELDRLLDLHVGVDTVVSVWEGLGTAMHVLHPGGFQTVHMSDYLPGRKSARAGLRRWTPIIGAEERPGIPFDEPTGFSGAGLQSLSPR